MRAPAPLSRRTGRPPAVTWLLALAWLAMACRAMVPNGFMPTVQGAGVQWLTLCAGSGQARVVAISLAEPTNDTGGDTRTVQAMHCPYAAQAGGQALPPPLSGLIAAVSPYVPIWALPPDSAPRKLALSGSPVGARAPPFLART